MIATGTNAPLTKEVGPAFGAIHDPNNRKEKEKQRMDLIKQLLLKRRGGQF